jgi:hypothetical protein
MYVNARPHVSFLTSAIAIGLLLPGAACTSKGPRTIHVAQSGTADVIGNDSAALQKAAGLLRYGDTLTIGEGVYTMNNTLLIPSGVTVRGVAGRTILRKSAGVESALAEDGDYGETGLRVAEPEKFKPGMGVAISDDTLRSGWDVSISAVTAVEGNLLRINPMTLRDYNREKLHARVSNNFPILAVIDGQNVILEGLTVDGNKAQNTYLDGCRGGAIYLYRVKDITVRNCVAHDYNGDGISFQITSDVKVLNSESYGHTGYGVHPGTGSERPTIQNCRIHDNGQVGLFLCWRVRHGKIAHNSIESNGQYGISIGHKDTDNEFEDNTVTHNGVTGVLFRDESFANSGHRCTFRGNRILDNGDAKQGYGFLIYPRAGDIVIDGNQIAETRATNKTQRFAVYKLTDAGSVTMKNNEMKGHEKDYVEAKSAPTR